MMSPTIKFLHKSTDLLLNCNSIKGEGENKGLEVFVESLEGAQVGAVLKLDFEGYNYPDNDKPIPETKTSLNHFLTPEDIQHGVVLKAATWDKHVKYIRKGAARATCTINGGSLASVLDQAHFIRPDGSSCFPV